MMVLSLTVGLGLGTLVGFALKAGLCLCNPFSDHSGGGNATTTAGPALVGAIAWGF